MVVLGAEPGQERAVKPPQIQLGLLPGFEGPILPAAPIELEPPKPPRRAVSAERELLAAQRSLAISLDPPDIEGGATSWAASARGSSTASAPRSNSGAGSRTARSARAPGPAARGTR